MGTTITGNDTFPATVRIPSDGDDETAASVVGGMQDLADRSKYMQRRLLTGDETGANLLVPNLSKGVLNDGALALRNGGHIASQPDLTAGTDADETHYITEGDVWFTPARGANRHWTVSAAGCVTGSRIRIYDGANSGNLWELTLMQPNGSTPICVLEGGGTVAGRYLWVELYCANEISVSAAWRICGGQKVL